jgi:hypothetical protein
MIIYILNEYYNDLESPLDVFIKFVHEMSQNMNWEQ